MRLADIEPQLSELWRQTAADGRAVVRACTMNLLVVCGDPGEAPEVSRTIAGLSEQHPARALVLARGGGTGLEAFVSAHCHRGPGDRRICSEQITLEAGAVEPQRVLEAVLHLLVPDVPVFTWWRGAGLSDDPLLATLLGVSDRFIVNTAAVGDAGTLPSLARIAADRSWRGNVGDLAWVRTEQWRDLIASLFDAPAATALLPHIFEVRITGGRVPCAYLAGWLASRLGWERGDACTWRAPDGRTIDVRIERDPSLGPERVGGIRIEASGGEVAIERAPEDETEVRLLTRIPDACCLPRTGRLFPADDLTLLHGELQRDARDPLFEGALTRAAALCAA